jgi:fluoroacetyl-CoA thioesterase
VLRQGLRGEAHMTVEESDTATALGSGDVPVLGTPRVLALVEQAAVAALRGELDEGQTSVGVAVDLQHLRATPVGGTVQAEAVLSHADERGVHFAVRAWDERGDVARGTHHRALVERERFLRRLLSR